MRKTLYEGKFVRLVDDDGWEFADRVTGAGVVCIAAIDGGHVLLVEEFRRAVQSKVISLPAGLIDEAAAGHTQETPIEAALRELREETGYSARSIEETASGPISAGMTTEQVTFFLAHDLKPGGQMLDAGEDITVHRVPLARLSAFLAECTARGAAIDPKVFAGLYFAKTRGLMGDAPIWWKGLRARMARMQRGGAGGARGLPPRLPAAELENVTDEGLEVRFPRADHALGRLGKVLNWLGLAIGLMCGVWVLGCIATLLGAFGYADTVDTAVLLIAGVIVGSLAWLAGRAALYVLAGR